MPRPTKTIIIPNVAMALPPDEKVQNSNLLTSIINLASNQKVDVAKMESLLAMHNAMCDRQSKTLYQVSMRDCQAEILPVARDAENSHTKSKYAKLEKIDKAIRPIYTKYGFSLSFDEKDIDNGKIMIFCYVMHIDGQRETFTLAGKPDTTGFKGTANKNDMQGLGSAVSYLRRYLTCMVFNIQLKDEDDDAVSAGTKFIKNEFAEKVNADSDHGLKLIKESSDMKSDMKKLLNKADRIELINKNIGFLQRLDAAGHSVLVQEIHTLAEEGE